MDIGQIKRIALGDGGYIVYNGIRYKDIKGDNLYGLVFAGYEGCQVELSEHKNMFGFVKYEAVKKQ